MKEPNDTPCEFLTFTLSEQEYALDIMSVREIRGWTKTTPMPHAPDFMRGVINLRGTVLPVIDLAVRLGLEKTETTERNVIIVVKHQDAVTGLLVDAVSDIITLSNSDMQQPPEVGLDTSSNTISSLSLYDERMIRILQLGSIVVAATEIAA
ncbi:MAG: chemotaxis protein CheW [Paracoccaceae bacterium]